MRSVLARAVRSAALRRIAVVVVVVLGYQLWLGLQASGKVADDVGQQVDERGRFSVEVRLNFAPERFHILRLQEHGRVAGTDGDTVHLRGVSPAGVDAVARQYWVAEIDAGTDRVRR